MARHTFGGGAADWAFTFSSDGTVAQAAGTVLTFWDALSGGDQYGAAPMPGGVDDGTGLLDGTGVPVATVTTDGNGEIPAALQGPDGVYRLAADASGTGSGPRRWIYASDFGNDLTTLFADVAPLGVLQMAPYVYYDVTTASYPARPDTDAPIVWWVGPVSPTVGGTGGAEPTDIWLNTSSGISPGGVTAVSSGDGSIVVSGPPGAPIIETGTLDEIAAAQPPLGDWSNNGHRITSAGRGVNPSDVATYQQTPAGGYTATIGQGGTGQITQPAALTALTGTQVAGTYLRSDGTNTTLQPIQAADLPAILPASLPAASSSAPGVVEFTTGPPQATGTTGAGGSNAKVTHSDHVHAQNFGGIFGDGSDGNLTLDGTSTVKGLVPSAGVYTMTRDLFATNFTINATVTLIPAGYRIFCQGTFTCNGTVAVNGNAGTATVVGATTGNGTVGGGAKGTAGQAAAGNAGTSGGVGAGASGTGGSGSGGLGGAAGTVPTSSVSLFRAGPAGLCMGEVGYNNANQIIAGGAGGAGGGGDGTNKGGCGGSGGGVIAIIAWAIVNNGTFSAVGGNGGAAPAGACGGGSGGGGGLVLGYSLAAWTPGTITLTGGTGAAGVGAGTAGGNGAAGNSLNVVVA